MSNEMINHNLITYQLRIDNN